MRSSRQVLGDICEQPWRDDLRLEYAASCELKDPVYAQYIRTRLEKSGEWSRPLSVGWDGPRVEARIAHPLRELCYDVTLRRGFIDEITIDPYLFIDRGGELLDAAPIQRVVFTPKPMPSGLSPPLWPQSVPSPIREVMACPHLDRLYSVAFQATNYQAWSTHQDDLEGLLESRHLGRLIDVALPSFEQAKWLDDMRPDLWERAFARPEFRKMLSISFPGDPGESVTTSETLEDHIYYEVTQPVPMTEQGWALERQHGYLPALHLHNRWDATDYAGGGVARSRPMQIVLAHQRGELPRFPVGAPVTDEMYALPPPQRRQTGNDW